MGSCCFTGHRAMSMEEQQRIYPILMEKLTEATAKGVTVFRNGGALGFDTMSALSVIRLKERHPQLKLFIDAPHRGQSERWEEFDRNVYEYILARADKVTYVSERYQRGCMQKRNRFMVDNSDFVIAYVKRIRGGSYYTACYAESLGKEVVYL